MPEVDAVTRQQSLDVMAGVTPAWAPTLRKGVTIGMPKPQAKGAVEDGQPWLRAVVWSHSGARTTFEKRTSSMRPLSQFPFESSPTRVGGVTAGVRVAFVAASVVWSVSYTNTLRVAGFPGVEVTAP